MAIFINISVYAVFHFMRKDTLENPLKIHMEKYAGYIVSDIGEPPDMEKMKILNKNLHIRIVYKSDKIQTGYPEKNPVIIKQMHGFRHFNGTQGWAPGHYVKTYQGKDGVFTFIVDGSDSFNVIPRRVLMLLIFLSLLLFFSWIILRKLLLPLKQIEEAYTKVGNGDFNLRLDLKKPRELVSMGMGFNSMLDNIRKMIDGRQQMLRDVSHELRTPLTRMKLNLAFMQKTGEKEAIEEDIRSMEQLIDEILETYRLSSGKMELQLDDVNLNKLNEKIIAQYKNSTHGKLQCMRSQTDIIIKADEKKLIRLFSNLIENALKHNEGKDIIIETAGDNTGVLWKITDFGNGIADNYLDKIFEPFFQIESSRNPAGSGYGLGLYICRRIAEEHGGSISYERKIPSGSCFTVRFPFAN